MSRKLNQLKLFKCIKIFDLFRLMGILQILILKPTFSILSTLEKVCALRIETSWSVNSLPEVSCLLSGIMLSGFVPLRSFLGRGISQAWTGPCLTSVSTVNTMNSINSLRRTPFATMSARQRRRAVGCARINAHKAIKAKLNTTEAQLLPTYVMIPSSVRERCSLTPRLARVKVFLNRDDALDVSKFRLSVRSAVVGLFPELEERRLLSPIDGFDLRVPGTGIVDSTTLLHFGIDKCDNAGSPFYVEIIPHNIPPPRQALSNRVDAVKQRTKRTESDPELQLHMVSFYKFIHVPDPSVAAATLAKTWGWMGVKGRVYVAHEGINAQLAVPAPSYQDFCDAMNGLWVERDEPVIPNEFLGVFLNIDGIVQKYAQPFQRLSVRPREKILADGLNSPLNWELSGREVPVNEWHDLVKDKSDDVVLLDCRNDYESNVGRFEGAEALNTRTFRETWQKLEERLAGLSKDTPILTYCTGGIRCVKVNAFLEQKMGFKNTARLSGGIVSYARSLREHGHIKESVFRGVNHVFDGRMGEVITNDLLDHCENCGSPCNVQTDCANVACDRPFDKRIFVQCANCSERFAGACSEACFRVVIDSNSRSTIAVKGSSKTSEAINGGLAEKQIAGPISLKRSISDSEEYADAFSAEESEILKEIRAETEKKFPTRSFIMSSRAQALLLKLLVQMCGAKRVLEIGTFTGYSALSMAEGLPNGGKLVGCEMDDVAADIANNAFQRYHGRSQISLSLLRGNAHELIEQLVPCDASEQFDFAFIDADKGGYEGYVRTLLDKDILKVGGWITVDNVLFRGNVPSIWKHERTADLLEVDEELARMRLNNLRNMRKTAGKLHSFNHYVSKENRLEQVILPFRDGLTIARRLS